MKTPFVRAFGLFTTLTFAATLAAPGIVEAKTVKKVTKKKASIASYLYNPKKHYKDEHVDISNPVSKCVTPSVKATFTKAMEKADAVGLAEHVTTSTPTMLGDAYRKYHQGLGYAWEAMTAPYCGYGAFGVSAAAKSFEKSLNRLQSDFSSRVSSLKKSGEADKPSQDKVDEVKLLESTKTQGEKESVEAPEAPEASEASATVVAGASSTTVAAEPADDHASSTEAVEPEHHIFKMANGIFYSPELGVTSDSEEALQAAFTLQPVLTSSTQS